ncbi:iron-siderophore ABC transporter substrate-binding protein [Jiella avicenniae]|uniref:Iron-siderophore ABC transporter substrate-binding protein n=1 Tax=Jiella avicenniae TaxID=2907202 RepID=A0A9X1T687_9HYPH|nr:iron-siderophore ABC transporter substrate-binding protein [Jiella avicenniae]MCE7029095.1 iron-siderophore ABC transporter substrate-binding protein [Jiella avicenniae]
MLFLPSIRRTVLALFVAALAAAPVAAGAQEPATGTASSQRIVVMEWAALETLLALGRPPVGAADAEGYREWVGEPALPETVAGVGSRQEPNLEEIARLKPDLVLSHAHLRPLKEKLAALAPVEEITFNGTGGDAYATVVECTRRIGDLLGETGKAEALIASADETFGQEAKALQSAGLAGRHVYFVRIIGPNALRVHGKGSIADTVLSRLGLTNAYPGDVNEWGFALTEPSVLAEDPDAAIVVAGPVTDEAMASVFATPLGKALPAVRAGRVHALPITWTFGGIDSAKTMAHAIAAALTGTDR